MKLTFLTAKITKIIGERNPSFSGKVALSTNINIKKIEEHKSGNSKLPSLKVDAMLNINYGDLGNIEIEGQLYFSGQESLFKTILKDYSNKKLNSDELVFIMNILFQKLSIKALELEEELNLPIHLKLPSLETKKE